jgi:hypothetical protein
MSLSTLPDCALRSVNATFDVYVQENDSIGNKLQFKIEFLEYICILWSKTQIRLQISKTFSDWQWSTMSVLTGNPKSIKCGENFHYGNYMLISRMYLILNLYLWTQSLNIRLQLQCIWKFGSSRNSIFQHLVVSRGASVTIYQMLNWVMSWKVDSTELKILK